MGDSNVICGIPILLLYFVYWFTRGTTTGIDIPATHLLMLGSSLSVVNRGISDYTRPTKNHWIEPAMVVTDVVVSLVPIVLQLRLLRPWDRSPRSRSERASIRTSRTITFGLRVAVVLGMLFVSYATPKFLLFRKGSHPADPARHVPALPIKLFLEASRHLIFALYQSSTLFQLLLNHKRGTFAGSLGITTYLSTICRLAEIASESSWVVGRLGIWSEVTLGAVIDAALESWFTWQALTLPKVPQVVKPEDEAAE